MAQAGVNPADWGAERVTAPAPAGRPAAADGPAAWGALPVAAPAAPAATGQDMSAGDITIDTAKSVGIGGVKGAIGIAGMAGDIAQVADAGIDKLAATLAPHIKQDRNLSSLIAGDKGNGDTQARIKQVIVESLRNVPHLAPLFAASKVVGRAPPTSAEIQGKIEEHTGEFYKPKSTLGHYGETVGEFTAGAMLPGGGGALGRFLKFALLPGVASEAAGQAAQKVAPAAEPYVRPAAAVLTGGGAAMVARPKSATSAVRSAMPEHVDNAMLDTAENLFQEARIARVPITRAEAIDYVSNGATKLSDLQRVVEGAGELKPFFAQRAGQVEAAGRSAFDEVAPATNAPSSIGPAVGRAAEEEVTGVRQAINTVAEPHYDRAALVRLSQQEMQRVRALPGYDEARATVQDNPQLARYVQGLPEDSVGFLNEVKKQLNQMAENASAPVNAQRNMQVSSGLGSDATVVRDAGVRASRDYETALDIERLGRERFLQPLLDGPLGKIASKDTTTKAAIEALFPANPLPNSADEITTAVTALARRRPAAARELVRAYVESVFNEATQNLVSGPNQFGGAKFAAVIRGNPQQAANLEAAVRTLPNGDHVWTGLDRFLQFVEAQGTRQKIGSQTAFNTEVLADLRRGTPVQEAGTAVATGGIKLPTKVKDTLERWRLGKGAHEIATLLTSPEAANRFRQIATMPQGSREAQAVAARLVLMANKAATHGDTPAKVDQTGQQKGDGKGDGN